jgi:DNA-binding Lrp family transcriptional regulator
VAVINPATVGYTTCAFVHVFLEGEKNEKIFVESVLRMPEVQECHRLSFLKPIWEKSGLHSRIYSL